MLKQFDLTRKKALKKKQFHPENVGKCICETVHFKIFPGGACPRTPHDPSSYATSWVNKSRALPPQKNRKFLDPYAYDLAGMIKFGRANSPNTPPPLSQQKDGSFAPE